MLRALPYDLRFFSEAKKIRLCGYSLKSLKLLEDLCSEKNASTSARYVPDGKKMK